MLSKFFDGEELRKTLILMIPLYIAHLMNAGMGIIDTIVAGGKGAQELAGVALGTAICWPVIVSLGCVLTIIGPMLSRLRGSGHEEGIGSLVNNSKVIALLLSVLACSLMFGLSFLPSHASQDPVTAQIAQKYVMWMLLGVPATIMMRAISGYFEGQNQTRPAMLIATLGLLVNYPLNYAFVRGWGPFPEMGGAGCGLATSIIAWAMVLGFYALMYSSRAHHQHAINFIALRAPNLVECKKILTLGYPLGIALFCEATFFCAMSLVIAPLGNLEIGAHQITLNISAAVFMMPLTLGIAASIRAAYHVGAHNEAQFRKLESTLGLAMLCVVTFSTTMIISFRYQILSIFTPSAELIEIAQGLVILCALYQLPDAIQALISGFLRGCHDTKILSSVNILAYWLIGFPLAFVLIHTDWIVAPMGAAGAWVCFIVALSVTSILLSLRFRRTRRTIFQTPHTP